MNARLTFLRLAVLVLGTWLGLAAHAAPAMPNIVLILADDLGINDLGCYGRREHRTPHLDRLAWEGMRFTSAYCSQPICSPSRAGLLTGKTPARLHLTTYLPGRPDCASQRLLHPQMAKQLPLEEKTLAEHLRERGYVTGCFGKWHLGGKGFEPTRQGFDVFQSGQAVSTPGPGEGSKGEFGLTAAAMKFIETHRERPFFLYLPHDSPHIPYAATPESAGRFSGAFDPAYAAVMESLDASVGRLLAKLDELGLRENTLVIFTSDNGGLHVPELKHARVTHNTPFRAGKGYLYEGGLRVPLLVRWPGRVAAGVVTDTPVINTDWLPTLLELTGAKTRVELDGTSIAPLLLGKGRVQPRAFAWHFPHYTNQGGQPAGAWRDGDWKLIEHYEDGRLELFHLRRDPGETKNLAAAEPRRVRRMQGELARWRRAIGAQSNSVNPQFDRAAYDALYTDFVPSRFDPLHASDSDWARVARWRSDMDAAAQIQRR